MLIAQLSDVHVGGARHDPALLRSAIAEINQANPDLVVIAGDITDEGYPDQYETAKEHLQEVACPNVVAVPGNHDSRHVGYLQYEQTFGTRDSVLRLEAGDGTRLALVAVDSSKPDLDEGEIGREHYAWIEEGFREPADLRVFVCHHHLMPIPGTGRERNQVLDAGDVLSLLRQHIAGVEHLVALPAGSGDRHQMVVADEYAQVRWLAEALLDPGVVLAPDLALVEIRLGGVDRDQRQPRPVAGFK